MPPIFGFNILIAPSTPISLKAVKSVAASACFINALFAPLILSTSLLYADARCDIAEPPISYAPCPLAKPPYII